MPSFVFRAQLVFVVLGGLYVLLVALLAIPYIQTHVLYLHAVNIPWSAKFDQPEYYGLPLGKTHNIKLTTTDNVTLGAWFTFSDPFYDSLSSPPTLPHHLSTVLRSRPTILFLHGNAANRAFRLRLHLYTAYSSHLATNVLAIDYRGFGDSAGTPSEAGLTRDARAAWDWLLAAGAAPGDVLVVGHSLGAAVAVGLTSQLAEEGVRCRGLVAMSPFSALRTLLDTYNIFGIFPLLRPLAMVPGAPALVTRLLVHKFDTLSAIPAINVPMLFVHAEDDWEIPHTHSDTLFDALLEPLLPPHPALPLHPGAWSKEDWDEFVARLSARGEHRAQIVAQRDVVGLGMVREFAREPGVGERVVVLKTREGGHDGVLGLEGVQDVMRSVFGLE